MKLKDIFIGLLILFALIAFLNQDFFFRELPNKIFGSQSYKKETLKIVTNTPGSSLSPHSLTLDNLIRTANVYQGLVTFDRNLKIIPALAVSWGNLDPTTWEFKLRKEVAFHDSTPFDADSFIQGYNDALKGSGDVKSLLATIQEIKKLDSHTIQVVTKEPDPLILSKLAKFCIGRPDNVGTGPYKIKEWKKGERLSLTAFTDYWGRHPAYRNADYIVTKNKTQRKKDFESGKIDILVAVPKDQALALPQEQVKTSYSLEVNFMMFKLDDPLLSDRAMREAIFSVFNPAEIEEIGNFFVRPVSQFVAPGVYGYNPEIPMYEYDKEKAAKDLFGVQKKKINLAYLSTYRTLAEYIQRVLREAGFLVKNNELSPEKLLEQIKGNKPQLYLLGWQAENGDAGDFLDVFIHSEGEFNNGRYVNPAVDKLIESSRQEINPQKRLESLQNILKLINDDLIGIPLFESSRLYAVKKGVTWEPRLDGLVLATDVK